MPHVFGANEVPEGAINAPRLVAEPSPDLINSPLWPRVGDVPSNPNDFPMPADIAQSMNEMENSRVEAANARLLSGIELAPESSKSSKTPQLPGF